MRKAFLTWLIFGVSIPVLAQVDLSGSWAARNTEDTIDKAPGPQLVDYTGLPLNAAGREKALSYSGSCCNARARVPVLSAFLYCHGTLWREDFE